MSFGLMSAPATFQRAVMEIFAEYLDKFRKVFPDDFSIYGSKDEHLQHLELCLQKCRENELSLYPKKYMIWITLGLLLDHVVCKEGLLMDLKKIGAIPLLPPPLNVKGWRRFLGAATHHRRFIWIYAEITWTFYSLF